MAEGEIQDALDAVIDACEAEAGWSGILVLGAVVPVVSDGRPEPKLVAAIGWLATQGRYRPIEMFDYGRTTDLGPIVEMLTGFQAMLPDAEAPSGYTGGFKLRH
ncbi:hypothetical protein [Ferrovibrio terrae]|uniref:hypothetical protein n=1 Tax=Ferrovibrio terrae TaxID=2594003 RepID=UPI003137C860